jgi:hypothetical protein
VAFQSGQARRRSVERVGAGAGEFQFVDVVSRFDCKKRTPQLRRPELFRADQFAT